MPMPAPTPDEQHDEFMQRCMSDDTMMEFDDEAQRSAVCEAQFQKVHGGATEGLSPRLYQHVTRAVFGTPWALLADTFEVVCDVVRRRAAGIRLSEHEINDRLALAPQRRRTPSQGQIAVVPLHGIIAQRMNLMTAMSGGVSTEMFGALLAQLVADEAVDAIVLDVDSPGGSVFGVPELTDLMHSLRGQKPIVAVANSLMASAAYWIASAADEIVVTPSGEVGSIGVIASHLDESKALAKQGVKVTYISAGRYKAEGVSEAPLSAETHEFLQGRVNEYYGMFVDAVARGRRVSGATVRSGFGEGRVVGAQAAVKAGMADRTGTLDETVSRLQSAATRAAIVRRGGGQAASLTVPAFQLTDYRVPISGAVNAGAWWPRAEAVASRTSTQIIEIDTRSLDSGPPRAATQRQQEQEQEPAQQGAGSFDGGSQGGVTAEGGRHMTLAGSRYQELQQQRAELVQQGRDIVDEAERAGRNLTPEQVSEAKQRNAQVTYLSEQIDVLAAQREAERLLTPGEGARASLVSLGGPSLGGARPQAMDACWGHRYGVRLVPDAATGGLKFGGVPRAFDVALGDFLGAVMDAGSPGGYADPRLFKAAASGGSTGTPADGGFMVGTDFSNALFDMAMSQSQLAQRCRPFEISAGSDKMEAPYVNETSRATGSRWGGVRVYRRAEADTVTASKPTLAKFELELEDLMGIAYMTGRQRQDAAIMGQVYRDAFTDEFAFVLDDEIFRGTGAGQCLGYATAANPALVSVSKETGQSAATVVAENVMKMYARMKPRSILNAVWFINIAITPQLHQMQVGLGTSGQLVYMPAGGLSGAPYGTLYGRPVIPIEQASALGTIGDITFVDLSQYILIRKGGIEEAESMHVRFLYDEMAFRWMQRVNGKPKDIAPLTPYKGSDTLSPFVALETRS